MKKSGFIANIINKCLYSNEDLLLTNGDQKRDFIHIEDAANAIITILDNLENSSLLNTYEIGSGLSLSIKDVVKLIHNLTNSRINLLFGAIPLRLNEPIDLVADNTNLKSLGWNSKKVFNDSIDEIIKFYKY